MNILKNTAAGLGAAALALMLGASARAANVVNFAAAGSSAQFSTFTQAFLDQGYTNHYSLSSSSSFQIVDPSAPNESAQVAIYWQGSPGNYQIAVFYQVDSTVGVRAFFNNDTLTAPASITLEPATSTRMNNVGQPGSGDVAPPAEVLAAVNGFAVNVGATDITPEDARVATERTINLGYNNTGNPVKGATNSGVATPVRFNLASKPFSLVPLGAVPIVVFINNGPSFGAIGMGGTNPPAYNLNIDSFTLAGFLSGQFNRTSDLILAQSANTNPNPVHVYVREPLSGTYNTMEYTNPESLAKLRFTNGRQSGSILASGGQELNVSATANNPLNEPVGGAPNGVPGAGRIRAIGTGQLVGAANRDTVDALGYAFYSAGTFTNLKDTSNPPVVIPTVLRYLTVDGADPIQDNYTGGSLTGATVTFRNIRNGGYPLWSILRVVEPQNAPNTITNIVTQAQNENNGTDFVTFQSLRVFRSYHQTPFTLPAPGQTGLGTPSNGNNGTPAKGGDVGGAVFSINNDVDNFNDFGGELTNQRQ